jgi:hypothetical protein
VGVVSVTSRPKRAQHVNDDFGERTNCLSPGSIGSILHSAGTQKPVFINRKFGENVYLDVSRVASGTMVGG